MDIPVSRLNQRMALQLPAEFPLGLVFVVGQVQMPDEADASSADDFYLVDSGYRLPCRLSERAAGEAHVEHGDMVRAGGHLAFEPARARYYLLARDIEHMDDPRPAANPLAAIIADSSRREQAATLTPAELPSWVQRMAPPEIRQQGDQALTSGLTDPLTDPGESWELLADAQSAVAYPAVEPELAGMSDELINFLSQAMDSEQEVELTSEIIADLNETGTTDRLSLDLMTALDEIEASMSRPEPADGVVATEESALVTQGSLGQPGDQFDVLVAGELQFPLDQLDELESELARTRSGPAPQPSIEEVSPEASDAVGNAEQPEPAAEMEQTEVPEGLQPTAITVPTASRQASGLSSAKPRTIPWYVVLLVIILFLMMLAALVILILNPGGLPLNLAADLPWNSAFPRLRSAFSALS